MAVAIRFRSAVALLGRFPALADGLDDLERTTLTVLNRAVDFSALFRSVTTSAALKRLGMGDVQFAALLRDLASGSTPLILIGNHDQPFGHWRISRTASGADVLAGRIDRLAVVPLERWLGGVHLRLGAPLWRWDAERLSLVRS